MAVRGYAFTMYPVSDLPRAVAFYEGALGLKREGLDSPFWTEFEIGGTTFGIGTFEQTGKPGSAQSLALEIEDLAAFRASLAAAGFEASEPHELANCRIATVKDPDGNVVWLHELK